jgi:hypothetical protein
MKLKRLILSCGLITLALTGYYAHAFSKDIEDYSPKEGDLIFQTETVPQAFAIQAATGSRYNHVGVVFKQGEKYYVYEAIGSVRPTLISSFVSRDSTHGRFTVMRVDRELSNSDIKRIKKEVTRHLGKKYDPTLGWSDSKMYCSELVWKAYDRGINLQLSDTRSIQERPLVSIIEKFVDSQFDMPNVNREDPIVSPADLARSNYLKTVFSNY